MQLGRVLADDVAGQDLPFAVAVVANRECVLWQGSADQATPASAAARGRPVPHFLDDRGRRQPGSVDLWSTAAAGRCTWLRCATPWYRQTGEQVVAIVVNARSVAGPGEPFKATTILRRDPGPRDVLLDIACTGICHSDIHHVRNEFGATRYPLVPGHEIAGTVLAVGSALVPLARRRTGVKNGCGTARDVVCFLVRSRPRISLTPGAGLPRGRSLSLRARGLDSSARPRFPGRYHLAG